MAYRRLGRTGLRVSQVGFGTCQLRLVPRQQALDTLRRGFELGVNIVHTAADYGGAIDIVAQAAREAPHPIYVCANGWGPMAAFESRFEQSLALFGRRGADGTMRLDMFGIASVEDRLLLGDDVWGPQGQVAFLQRKQREGVLGHIFCTTHGAPAFIADLIRSGAFDAVMFAYNALGHHALSYATPPDREREDLAGNAGLFELAARHDVGVMLMEVLGGGLLCDSKAFADRVERSGGAPAAAVPRPPASEILRDLLRSRPQAATLLPGTASLDEAEENARAGHASGGDARDAPSAGLAAALDAMRGSLCTRCGACEPTCSKGLSVSWLIRASDIERTGAMTFETPLHHHYFDFHPATAASACASCEQRSCRCPTGIDIPAELSQRHAEMLALRRLRLTPGGTRRFDAATAPQWAAELMARTAEAGMLRVSVRNMGWHGWHRDSAHPQVTLVLRHGSTPIGALPLDEDVPAGGAMHGAMALQGQVPTDETTLYLAVGDPAAPLFEMEITEESGEAAVREPTQAPVADHALAYLHCRHPERVPPCSTFGLWLRVRNMGRRVWHCDTANPVVVTVRTGGEVVTSSRLPQDVAPGESCDLHLVVTAPATPGRHTLALGFVQHGVAAFQAEVDTLDVALTVVGEPAPDADLHATAARSNWSFYHPAAGISVLADGTTLPRFLEQARGPHVWDSNRRRFIDYTIGWGCALLGHGNEIVESAVRRSMRTGPTLPLPHRIEMELTDALCRQDEIPCAEVVAFGKNGSDVCTLAIRLARACTGRKTVLVCGYHGWQDWYAEPLGFASTGVPERSPPLVVRVESGRMDLMLEQIRAHRADLAAVMLEPAGAAGGPRMVAEDADRQQLEAVARATREAGALLIFDEVITGFRYPQGSVQKATGVVPDMACFGKALANGFPLSALVGRTSVMRELSRTFYGPTFKGEVYALAAAVAALRIYRTEPVAEHVRDFGRSLQQGLRYACAETGVAAVVAGPAFRCVLHFEEPDIQKRRLLRTLYLQELLRRGVITYAGVMLPSYAHRDAELEQTLSAAAAALQTVARHARAGEESLHRAIEMPLLAAEA